MSEFIPAIQTDANQIARLDCLLSFATAARENNYIRPVISDDEVLEIHQGRHPVIEKQLPIGEKYVANDVMLDSSTQQIIIITGPNMAGKSALLRQTACSSGIFLALAPTTPQRISSASLMAEAYSMRPLPLLQKILRCRE